MLEAGLKDGSVDFYMGPRPQSAMPEGLVVEKPSEIPALSYVVWHIRLDGHDQRMSVSVVASPRFEAAIDKLLRLGGRSEEIS
jgi:hypothetical protein